MSQVRLSGRKDVIRTFDDIKDDHPRYPISSIKQCRRCADKDRPAHTVA